MSVWSFIAQSGWVVKIVLLILLFASISSWALILQYRMRFSRLRREARRFERRFFSNTPLNTLHQEFHQNKTSQYGLGYLFITGYEQYQDLAHAPAKEALKAAKTSIRIARERELDNLSERLTFLATVGSISPYIGLFGTVWGIIAAFQSLSQVKQATIAMVAPGISEALVATAIGLFAAIPAVIAYNSFSSQLDQLEQRFRLFEDELINLLHNDALRQGIPA